MISLLVNLLAILLAYSLSEAKAVSPTMLEVNSEPLLKTLDVFETGNLTTELGNLEKSDLASGSPPLSLLIARPTVAGQYGVILFIHGTCIENSFYSNLLLHIASHGFIVIAPQVYTCTVYGAIPVLPISEEEEVELSTEVANWLSSGLESALNGSVKPDLNKLAISGHSRGGKTAFAIQLGYSTLNLTTNFSALIGLDPVDGVSKENRPDPKILTYVSNSLNLRVPVAVIGTGLGSQSVIEPFPACAPDQVNHVEFYNDSKPPASHFVTEDYGHMDMLNDDLPGLMGIIAKAICKNSKELKDPMRRSVGGIIVAFLKAYLYEESRDYNTIMQDPSVAPARLAPVEFKSVQYVYQV